MLSVLNASLTLADWYKLRDLDSGIYGVSVSDPGAPENPALTMVTPRIVTLGPGQIIYRWVNSRAAGTPLHKAAGPWWSTKRGAQAILKHAAGGDTNEAARKFSNVARSWGSDLREVICARVTSPIRCVLGMGRAIYDKKSGEVLDGRGLQLYIPNLAEKSSYGAWMLSEAARRHLSIVWSKQSDYVSANDLLNGSEHFS